MRAPDRIAGRRVTRVLLVDDQPLVRAGLRRILEPEPDITIVGECEDGDEVTAVVTAQPVDVVLMDVRMKRVDGIAATRVLVAEHPEVRVLVLTTFDDDEIVAGALAAGASGFVLKDARGEELVAATRSVAAGDGWLDPSVTETVLATFRLAGLPRSTARGRLQELTDREVDVLRLIGRGATNAEIGAELHISEGTVKTHVGRILAKLGLRDRPAAIVYAFDHGVVAPPSIYERGDGGDG